MTKPEGVSLARITVVLACIVIVVAGMKAAASIIVPFLCAVFLTIITLPVVHWMRRRGIPDGLALALVLGGMVLVGVLLLVVIGSSLAGFQGDLDTYTTRLGEIRENARLWISNHIVVIDDEVDKAIDPRVILSYVGQAAGQLGGLMSNAMVILLMLAFLLAEAGSFGAKLQAVAGDPDAAAARVRQMSESVSQYFSIKTGISLLTGAMAGILLWIVGVDYPVLWAFLTFLLNFVPTIGSVLAAIPPVLLALVQTELGMSSVLVVAGGYLVINFVIGNVLEPRFMGRGLDLSTLVVFLSLLFWGWVLGPMGMLLSVPLTATVKIALEAFPEARGIARMLGSGAEPEAS